MSTHDESLGPEGYQVGPVEDWIAANVESLAPPFKWTRLQGGHSNLTYRLDDANGNSAVIRRPPQGELLPKAHDMSREWALISALGPTDVPVPAALGFCESPDVTGAWFYVMGLIDGHPLYNADDTNLYVPEPQRRKMAFSFIDVLAALHRVDPDEVGLGELGKKEDYVARQLKTWYRSWMASIEPADYDDPRAHELQRYFLENVPDQGPARVVHGDYGVHNCLVGPDCSIAAVVDSRRPQNGLDAEDIPVVAQAVVTLVYDEGVATLDLDPSERKQAFDRIVQQLKIVTRGARATAERRTEL